VHPHIRPCICGKLRHVWYSAGFLKDLLPDFHGKISYLIVSGVMRDMLVGTLIHGFGVDSRTLNYIACSPLQDVVGGKLIPLWL